MISLTIGRQGSTIIFACQLAFRIKAILVVSIQHLIYKQKITFILNRAFILSILFPRLGLNHERSGKAQQNKQLEHNKTSENRKQGKPGALRAPPAPSWPGPARPGLLVPEIVARREAARRGRRVPGAGQAARAPPRGASAGRRCLPASGWLAASGRPARMRQDACLSRAVRIPGGQEPGGACARGVTGSPGGGGMTPPGHACGPPEMPFHSLSKWACFRGRVTIIRSILENRKDLYMNRNFNNTEKGLFHFLFGHFVERLIKRRIVDDFFDYRKTRLYNNLACQFAFRIKAIPVVSIQNLFHKQKINFILNQAFALLIPFPRLGLGHEGSGKAQQNKQLEHNKTSANRKQGKPGALRAPPAPSWPGPARPGRLVPGIVARRGAARRGRRVPAAGQAARAPPRGASAGRRCLPASGWLAASGRPAPMRQDACLSRAVRIPGGQEPGGMRKRRDGESGRRRDDAARACLRAA